MVPINQKVLYLYTIQLHSQKDLLLGYTTAKSQLSIISLWGFFPDAQGQLTPQSLVRSGRISNSSEMLWMFSLPASMKKIRLKMKALEWTQHFPHYNPMGAIRCHGHQSSDQIWPKTKCSLSPTPMMVQIKFRYD